MLSLRNRFGIPGVISVIALVFAMFGGAYAATNPGGGGKATASAKGKPGPRGKTGKTGPQGPAGPAGPKGDTGSAGSNGKDGANGANGTNGGNGKSAEAISFAGSKGPIGGVTCTEGGLEVKSASATTLVCNGTKGTNGVDGETGFTETLPPEATETGAWGVAFSGSEAEEIAEETRVERTAISFPIPLPAPIEGENVIKVTFADVIAEEVPAECTVGGVEGSAANPLADPGFLCIYSSPGPPVPVGAVLSPAGVSGASRNGAVLVVGPGPIPFGLSGSFAVTAPAAP